MKKELHKKEIERTCFLTLYLLKLFSIKNSLIRNYEEFEGKVCNGYLL